MSDTKKYLIFGIGVLCLVFVAFGQALFHSFAPSDDLFLVVQNLAVRGPTFSNLKTVFTSYDPELYIPLTFVSYQIDYVIGGLHPLIFHLTNLILHAVNALLVFTLLTMLTGKKKLSVFAAAIFAIHPLQTEAVVWIAGRKDLLSTCFYLLAFITYIRFRRGKKYGYISSLAFFLCALLSKVNVLMLPVVLLLFDSFIEKREWRKSMLIDKIPYALLSGTFLIIALAGKERVVDVLSNYEMLLLASKSTLFTIWKFVVPFGLTIIYPHNGPITLNEFLPFSIGLFLLLTVMITARKRAAWMTFGIAFFLVSLLPTFSNTAKAGFIFFAVDRYMYLPMIGLLFLFVQGISRLTSTPVFKYSSILFIFIFTTLSFHQTRTWENGERLYTRAVEIYPESVPASTSLARTYRKQKEYKKAFDVLLETLKHTDHPALHLESGYVYANVGQVADAREQFTITTQMDPKNAEAVFSLGSLEEQVGNTQRAQQYFQDAINLDSSYVIARVRLAAILMSQKNFTEAKEHLLVAITWNPNSLEAHDLLANLLEMEGDVEGAAHHRSIADELIASSQFFN